MQTRTRVHGPQVEVVYLEGDLDLTNAESVRRLLLTRLNGDVKHLVVNLEGLSFIDSTGLGAFVAAMLKARTVGCRMSLIVPNKRIRDTFQITGMRQGEQLFATEEEVLKEAPVS